MPRRIEADLPYDKQEELTIVSTYFNPSNFRSKYQNCLKFIQSLNESQLSYLIVECVFDDAEFALPHTDDRIVRIRASSVLWQKERLLNVAIAHLPPTCRYVAWLDCDILFADRHWTTRTVEMLQQYPILQPFEFAIRLPMGQDSFSGSGDTYESFGSKYSRDRSCLSAGGFATHGHTGFGWVAQRKILEQFGLYDRCISGSADHVMCHAFCSDWNSPCVVRLLGNDTPLHRDFVEWASGIAKTVSGRVYYVPGTILHLWHGEVSDRKYVHRNKELRAFNYDPKLDIQLDSQGCWSWTGRTPQLVDWAIKYFSSRNEDGTAR